jgi:serine phosphatase RsbU (regulator of sigma subunit)
MGSIFRSFLVLACFFSVAGPVAHGRSPEDSLQAILKSIPDSGQRVKVCLEFIRENRFNREIILGSLYDRVFAYYLKNNDFQRLGTLSGFRGIYYFRTTNYDSSAAYYLSSHGFYKKAGNELEKITSLSNYGISEMNRGKYDQAFAAFLSAHKDLDELIQKNKDNLSNAHFSEKVKIATNIASFYIRQKDLSRATDFLEKESQELNRAFGKVGGALYTALGGVFYYQEKNGEALDCFAKALVEYEKEGDFSGMGFSYNNIGLIHQGRGEVDKAIGFFEKSMEVARKMGDSVGVAESFFNIGESYSKSGRFGKAEAFFLKALQLAELQSSLEIQKDCFKALADLTRKQKRFEDAFAYQEKYSLISDSLINQQRTHAIAEMQTRFDTEKQVKENSLLKEQFKNQELRAERQKMVIFLVCALSLLLLSIAFFIYRSLRQKKKVNEQLTLKNKVIEEQNKDIKDSIRYAKRIQESILPPLSKLEAHFPDSFVFFKPKDIVSGDFFWFDKFGEKFFFAAADCTGHGVPGAFMSIMGGNLLNQAVNEFGIDQPHAILNAVNKGLAKALRSHSEDGMLVRDGMDIALGAVDLKTRKFFFSGAFNPCWIFKKEGFLELPADKHPVGTFSGEKETSFTLRDIDLESGDRIYVFSDGFADQFGGPKGKKFKSKPFRELLGNFNGKPMAGQVRELEQVFNAWKGDLEQVDDVLVIGIRV